MSLDSKQAAGEKAADKLTAQLERELIKAYAAGLKSIRAQIAEVYARYGTDSGLTYSEMQKYNRLANLEKQIMDELKKLTGKNAKSLEVALGLIFQSGYYYTAYALESELGLRLGFGLLNPEVIKASIQNPISGLTLNETLAKRRAEILIRLRQEITQGLINGESYKSMAERLKTTLEGDAQKALLVAQTEAHRVQNEGRVASLDKATSTGLELERIWTATLDERTRQRHRELDGMVADKDGVFKFKGMTARYPGGWGVASMDIRCRCAVRGRVRGVQQSNFRSARNQSTGKSELVPNMTYAEWAALKGVK